MDPVRMLGGLLRTGVKRQARQVGGAAIGMGLIGVAIAAFEHFNAKPDSPAPPAGGPAPGPPPVPPVPPPPAARTAPPQDAVLLVRAMIAAAYADGQLDAEERRTIVDRLSAAGLAADERAFVAQELLSPASIDDLVAQARSPELAEQVYAASLLAIRVDTDAERQYLADLAARLALDAQTVERIHTTVS
jgi:uncharacterized membrane protein YebE (DUF533 family)